MILRSLCAYSQCLYGLLLQSHIRISYHSLTLAAGDLGSSLDSNVCDDCITSSAMADREEKIIKKCLS